MRKILGLTVAALMVMGLVGFGTWAYFSDPETATGNVFTAGTIDLKVDDVDWTSPISLTNLKPGDTSSAIVFKNTGSLDADLTFTWASLAESDHADDTVDTFEYAASGTVPDADLEMTDAEYQRLIYVTIVGGGGATGVLTEGTLSPAGNGDGKISFYELAAHTGDVATLPADATATITFILGDAFDGGGSSPPSDWTDYLAGSPTYDILTAVGWDVPQADGLTIDITATLKQTS